MRVRPQTEPVGVGWHVKRAGSEVSTRMSLHAIVVVIVYILTHLVFPFTGL